MSVVRVPLSPPPDMAVVSGLLRYGAHLRERGLPATTGRMLDLLRAMPLLDLRRPDDLYWASRCMLVDRADDLPAFDAAFLEFWSPRRRGGPAEPPPHALPHVLNRSALEAGPVPLARAESMQRSGHRVGEAFPGERLPVGEGDGEGAGVLSWSGEEVLREKDFAALTADEVEMTRRLLERMQWQVARRRSRRLVRAARGSQVDWRRSLRRNAGHGGVLLELERLRNKTVKRPFVVIADVSGSMDRYTRPALQLVHTLRAGHGRVEAFVFGTRLTRVTRQLAGRDPTRALRRISGEVQDWAGGTRIGDALAAFNRGWGRRVLGRGAVVLILSDGWDRGDPAKVAAAMARLQRRSHRVVWLNPTLGGPAPPRPLPLGMRAALPFVDDLLPARCLNDLLEVGRLLERLSPARPERRGDGARLLRGAAPAGWLGTPVVPPPRR